MFHHQLGDPRLKRPATCHRPADQMNGMLVAYEGFLFFQELKDFCAPTNRSRGASKASGNERRLSTVQDHFLEPFFLGLGPILVCS